MSTASPTAITALCLLCAAACTGQIDQQADSSDDNPPGRDDEGVVNEPDGPGDDEPGVRPSPEITQAAPARLRRLAAAGLTARVRRRAHGPSVARPPSWGPP